MKNLKHRYSVLTFSLFSLIPFFWSQTASAQSDVAPATIGNINIVATTVFSSIISLVGFASFGMLLYGGYRYLSAGADKNASTQAHQTITYSLAGLIITLSSWVILNLIGNFLGVDLGVFDICITPGC